MQMNLIYINYCFGRIKQCRISMNKQIKKIDIILLAHFILNLIIVRKYRYAKSSCNYMQCQIK